jgi:hypothetical protein
MTDKYDTPLTDEEEKQYQAWSQEHGNPGTSDYDMRGFWKSGEAQADNGHYPDTFKKPNHPTFSDESMYSGKNGEEGGHWEQVDGDHWKFTLGPTERRNGASLTEKYLQDNDPNSQLDEAGSAAAGRDLIAKQAEARKQHMEEAIARQKGIGMEEPNLKLEGPGAADASATLAKWRGAAHWDPNQELPPVFRHMAEARAAGYSWDEINQYIAQQKDEAKKAGYSNDDINKFFLGAPLQDHSKEAPPQVPANLPDQIGSTIRQFSEKVFGAHEPFTWLGLPEPGMTHTAGSILQHLGWNVVDFAKTLPASVVDGAGATAEMFDGKDRTDLEWIKLGWEASAFLGLVAGVGRSAIGKVMKAGEGMKIKPPVGVGESSGATVAEHPTTFNFPQPSQFMDAATYIAREHPEGLNDNTFNATLKQLGEHYAKTGEPPVDVMEKYRPQEWWKKIADEQDNTPLGHDAAHDRFDILDHPDDPWMQDNAPPKEQTRKEAIQRDSGAKPANENTHFAQDEAAKAKIVPPEAEKSPLDISRSVNKWKADWKALMDSEDGAMRIGPRTDIDPALLFRPDPEVADGIGTAIRSALSPYSLAPNAAESAGAHMARTAIELERATRQLNRFGRAIGDMSSTERWGYIDAIESGNLDAYRGTVLGRAAGQLRRWLDYAYDRMDSLGIAPEYVENYLPHMYGDPAGYRQFYASKRPVSGSKFFTRGRVFGSYAEAREAGLTPITDNPLHMTLTALHQMFRYIAAHETLREFREAGIVQPEPPLGSTDWTRVNQRFGLRGEGEFFASRPVANLLDAMVDPGLSHNPLYRTIRSAANGLIGLQLAGPGFHLSFVTLDSMFSDLGRASEQISRMLLNPPSAATLTEGARGVRRAIFSPVSPALDFMAGRKLYKALVGEMPATRMTQEVRDIAQAFIEGGGRASITPEYRGSAMGSFLGSFKGSIDAMLGQEYGHQTFMQDLGEIFRNAQPIRAWGRTVAPGAVRGMFTLFARTMDTIAAPLMEKYVPTMKMGVFYRSMQSYMKAAPDMGPLEIRHLAHTLNKSIDNKLGEMVYDNRFWNRTGKDIAHLTLRAVGWNAGDVAELGGGIYDAARLRTMTVGDMRQVTTRTGSVMGYTAGTIMLGAVISYIAGTWSEDMKPIDYLFPKINDTDRIQLPTYAKEVFGFTHHTEKWVTDKFNPLWPMLMRTWRNRDWNDAAIWDPKDEPITKFEDWAKWFGRQLLPISIQQQLHPTDAQNKLDPALRWMGIQPAPYEVREPERAEKYKNRDDKTAVKKRDKARAKESAREGDK